MSAPRTVACEGIKGLQYRNLGIASGAVTAVCISPRIHVVWLVQGAAPINIEEASHDIATLVFFLARSGYLSCFLASLGCIASLELIGEFRIVSSANKYATSPLNAFPSPSSYTRKQVAATSLEMFETFDVD
jgi:hypothetical protein